MKANALVMAVGLAVAALGSVSTANAVPLLQIVTVSGQGSSPEVVGDAGGSVYPYAGGPGVGAGVPSSTTTPNPWPNGPGFAPDPSFPGSGTSGWDTSYLWLTQSANVTFQFMGGGDSSYANQFWVNGVQLFQDPPSNNATDPCAVTPNGATAPSCTAGVNQFTIPITVAAGGGYVPFWFVTGAPTPVTVTNDGINNPNDESGLPGYMLGADPYLAPGPFSCLQANGESCTTVYAALSDRSRVGGLDHDYSDMGVRITVPEPGTVFLLGIGMMGIASSLRRRKV